MFSIEAIMSTNLITVPSSATLAEARTLMQSNNIHHLPVADEGNLVGLVTITNVLAATDSFLRDDRHRIHANEIIVGDVMVKDVATVDVNASLRQAALFLEKHQIGCLPVMGRRRLSSASLPKQILLQLRLILLEQIESTRSRSRTISTA